LITPALDEPCQVGCVAGVSEDAQRVDPLGQHEEGAEIHEGTRPRLDGLPQPVEGIPELDPSQRREVLNREVRKFPSLFPSARPQHGLLLTTLLAVGAAVGVARWRAGRRTAGAAAMSTATGVRIAAPTRLADAGAVALDAEWETEEALRTARPKRMRPDDGHAP
jgi:hypothetical protein